MIKETLVALALGVAVGAVLLALGERIRLLLRIPVPPGLRPGAAFALGSVALGLDALVLGFAGLFRPVPLMILALLAAAVGKWTGIGRLGRLLAVPALASLPLLVVALAPPFFYDAWVYHLGLPWQALQDGALRAHPGNLFSTFPPLAQLVYAFPLAWGVPRATSVVHLVGTLTACAAGTHLARRLGASRGAATLAGAALLYLSPAALVPAFPAAEAWAVSGTLTSVGLALAGRPAHGAALGAGLAAGAGIAARLQGIPWAALASLLLAVRAGRKALVPVAVFALAAAAAAAPWWLKNALLLGDPAAPLGWTRPGVEIVWRDAGSLMNLARGPAELASMVAGAMRGAAPLVLPLLAAGLVAYALDRRRSLLLVLGTAVAGWLAWGLTGALGRFLTPTLALLAVGAAAGTRRAGRALSLLVLALFLAWGVRGSFRLGREIGGLALLGTEAEVYARTQVSDPWPAFRAAAAALPGDARVLLTSEPRGFLFPRPFETASQVDVPELRAVLAEQPGAEGARAELVRRGYTHLLVNVAEMRRLGAQYPVLPWADAEGRRRFVALTRALGRPVVQEGGVVVYALGEGGREPGG